MIVVAIIGILAAIAIPSFMKYISKSKSGEARQFVKKISDGARAYFLDPNYRRNSIVPIRPQFPAPTQAPTPAIGSCCSTGSKCAPDASQWDNDVWTALQFSVDDPHFYSYSFAVDNTVGSEAYTARANGDLDCDGDFSTFEMFGVVNSIYSDSAGSSALARIRENE